MSAGNFTRPVPSETANSCQPLAASTSSPTRKFGFSDFSMRATVPAGMRPPIAIGAT